MARSIQSELARRGRSAFVLGAAVIAATTLNWYAVGAVTGLNAGYGKRLLSLEDDRWELSECLYASAVTLTTVGYTDVLGTDRLEIWRDAAGRHRWVSATDGHEDAGFDEASATLWRDYSGWTRVLTAVTTIVGIAFFLYVIAQVTSFFVEGAYEDVRRAVLTRRRLARMTGHVVISGGGLSARHAVDALLAAAVPVAVIDQDPEAAHALGHDLPQVPVLVGDATEEEILVAAGLARARGLICATGDDGMNVVVAVTARQLHPALRIVSRAFGPSSAQRQAAAGCAVVSPGRLAGLRVASELVRPSAAALLDLVLRPTGEHALRLEEMPVGEAMAGRRVGELDAIGLTPIALIRGGVGAPLYNPPDDTRLEAGDEIALLGYAEEMEAAGRHLGSAVRVSDLEPDEPPPNLDARRFTPAGVAPAEETADQLSDHFVVCGAGETGLWVVRELYATHRKFVVVESNPETVEALLAEMPGILVVEGDVEDPETLARAGIDRARGIATTLRLDRSNLLAVVTALQAAPQIRAVSLAWDDASERRLRRAGVEPVSKGRIGGNRMAAEMLRPQLTGFLERMLIDERSVRVESLRVLGSAPLAGKTFADAGAVGVRPIAVLPPDRSPPDFVLNPAPDARLEPGARLIAVCDPDSLRRLVEQVGALE